MTNVRYQATDGLPEGVPAAVIARNGDDVLVLVDRSLTVDQVCAALTPLITEYAISDWQPLRCTA